MELKYQIPTKKYYLEESDESVCDSKDIEFEPPDDELNECVATCIFDEYFEKGMFDARVRKELVQFIGEFISDKNLTEELAKEDYDIQVHDWFEKEATNGYK